MGLSRKILSLCAHKDIKGNRKLTKWLQKNKLMVSTKKCRICKKNMKLRKTQNKDGYQWVCKQGAHNEKVTKSCRSGSIFDKTKTSLQNWMTFIYRFCQGLRLRQVDMVQDGIAGSSATITKMTHKLRLVCRKALKMYKRKTGQRMGGRTEFIVIDESNFRHKRKYGQGRAGQTWRRKKWVFGMLAIKGQRRRPVLRLVERRSRNYLLPIIRRHVRQGSTILSDEWRPYRALSSLGYTHYSVNHSRWFVDPNHGGHTQNIERAWLTYKSQIWRLRGNRTEKLLKEHLSFIEWTYWLGYKHKDGPLGRLLKDIRRHYSN